jgi:acetylornithine deacetylase/succinyl-diaminopimelate desuccinylase-like protein
LKLRVSRIILRNMFLRRIGEPPNHELPIFTLSLLSLYRAIKHLLDILKPYNQDNGGPIKVEHIVFVKGRGNLILEYCPEGASGAVVFMGSHLDVVPANPETWERNPFELTVEVGVGR